MFMSKNLKEMGQTILLNYGLYQMTIQLKFNFSLMNQNIYLKKY